MKEIKAIIDAFFKIDLSSKRAALATVVKVRGSSYRSPGARMLISDDGQWVGSISGGCLEGDALRKARKVMADNLPQTVTYDTREESNQNLGIGLGCNGVIDVLLEPIDPSNLDGTLGLFQQMMQHDSPVALATIFKGRATGKKILMSSKTTVEFNELDTIIARPIEKDLLNLFESRKTSTRTYTTFDGEIEVFLELIQPSVSVLIFGGGFDARPVSNLAKSIGWNVEVTDECVAHIAPVFFPTADKLSLCQRDFIDRDFNITPYSACILMSHNYEYDRDVLEKLLKSPAPYIGILGPKKRFYKMLDEFSQRGIELTNKDLDRIHAPIGLDIGAEAPDEIAVSIIAEIQARFSNRKGGYLRDKDAPIHHRETGSDEVYKPIFISTSNNN